jgi:hypothetical protein
LPQISKSKKALLFFCSTSHQILRLNVYRTWLVESCFFCMWWKMSALTSKHPIIE